MMQFASVFKDFEIVASAMRQLLWGHFLLLIPIAEDTKRNFYTEVCEAENWSVGVIKEKINSLLFERTIISKKTEKVIDKGQMELYLSYLNKYEKIERENSLISLILCSGKTSEHIELMNLVKDNIKIAEYLLVLPLEKFY